MNSNIKSIIIGIMALIILIGGCYFLGQQVKIMKQEIQYESYQYGQLSIISQINQDGKVPVIVGQGNETNIQWVSLEQLCGGGE